MKKKKFSGYIFLGVVFVAIIFAVFTPTPTPDPEYLFYVVQKPSDEYNNSEYISEVYRLNSHGEEKVRIASGQEYLSFGFGFCRPEFGYSSISPDGETIVMFDFFSGNLVMYSDQGSTRTPLGTQSEISLMAGFSPDGKLYAYTTESYDFGHIVKVVNRDGTEILGVEAVGDHGSLYFGGFIDNDTILVIEAGWDNESGSLAIVDIKTGDRDLLVNFELEYSDWAMWHNPFLFDGDIYYRDDGEYLRSIPLSGGSPKDVYKFETEYYYDKEFILRYPLFPVAFPSPDGSHIVIIDGSYIDGEAYLILLDKDSDKTLIGKRVLVPHFLSGSLESLIYCRYNEIGYLGKTLSFSPNGKYIGYMSYVDEYGVDLIISNLDGTEHIVLVSSGIFNFSPDSKNIAYLELGEYNTLYIVDIDGSNRKLLGGKAENVNSFQFTPDGKYIVYTIVESLVDETPVSKMYRVGIDGENKELIMSAEEGIYTFLPVP